MNMTEMHYEYLAQEAAEQFKRKLGDMPPEVAARVEDELIPLLDWVSGWEPCDADMQSAFGTKWHDGL